MFHLIKAKGPTLKRRGELNDDVEETAIIIIIIIMIIIIIIVIIVIIIIILIIMGFMGEMEVVVGSSISVILQ